MSPDEITNRAPILLLLADLINAAPDSVPKEAQDPAVEDTAPLTMFKDEILGAVSTGLQVVTSRRPALAVIKALVTTKFLLSGEELGFMVHLVNEVLQADEGESEETRYRYIFYM
jgi:DNA repair/transcription protein MET18/MMS19